MRIKSYKNNKYPLQKRKKKKKSFSTEKQKHIHSS